jgi:hypothetical protein
MKNEFTGNWVLDITFGTNPSVFVPYEDDGSVVFGLMLIADKCPGKLVGIVHMDGQEAVDDWCSKNPDWHELYK